MPRRAGLRSRGIFYILIYWLDGETPSMTLPECTLGGFFRENKAAGVYRRHGNELSERTLRAFFWGIRCPVFAGKLLELYYNGKQIMKIRKKDIILLLLLLVLAGVGSLLLQLRPAADQVVIRQDGKIIGSYLLTQDREIVIDNAWGQNKIQIKAGRVSVIEADCPDQICVRHRQISRDQETIVCLPHRLVVEVIRAKEKGVDMIAD